MQQDLQRLRALLDVLQAGDASDDQVPLDNLASWKLAWQQRLAALEVRLSGQLPRLGEEAPARAQEVRNAIAESAAIQSQVLRMTSEGIGNDLPPSVWTNVQELGADTRRVSFTGQLQPQNPFTAAYAPAPASSRQALSITFLALVAGLVLGARRPFAFREWARANIHVLLISIALLWWTFMPLGWIGIACTLLLLLAASSSSWRATRR